MKTQKASFWGIMIACLLVFAACKRGDETVNVTGVKLNKSTTKLVVDSTETLVATVEPTDATDKTIRWSSDNIDIATVNGNGLVTAVAAGEATIIVTTVDGNLSASCVVTVETATHPLFGTISFKSDKTWTVGDQTWSDAVTATGCQKEDFDGGTYGSDVYKVDCRKNEGYGDWFSWEAVNQNKEALCPDGWRVPTREDFVALDIAFGGNGENRMMGDGITPQPYVEQWGAEFGGYCWVFNGELVLDYVNDYACYWGQNAVSAGQSESLNLGTPYAYVLPKGSMDKYNGSTVRCVK